MDLFSTLTPYHWIALGLILLTAEMLGTSGFLLGAAVAAFALGVLTWLLPDLALTWQLSIYAVSAVVASIVYFQVFRDGQAKPARPLLNKRARRLIGHQFELAEDIQLNKAKVQIGDTLWSVEVEEPVAQGTRMEVVDVRQMVLMLKPV